MTKEEKIKKLYEEYEKRATEIAVEKVSVTQEDFKGCDWKSSRIECAEEKDVSKAFSWLLSGFADYVSDNFKGAGVFDITFCMKRRGDFDNSEGAQKARVELKQKQQALSEEFRAEVLKIENEQVSEVTTECH